MTGGGSGLAGRVAVVTGGSKGIGFACARALVDAGAHLAITARHPPTLAAARKRLGDKVMALPCDAADHDSANRCLDEIAARFGRIDILVNNAGGSLMFGPLMEIPLAVFDDTWRLNLRAPLVWTRGVWERSMREHGGVVLMMASLGGITLQPAMGAYSVAKAGLIHLTRILAAELAPAVRVNAVAPGLVRTDAIQEWSDGVDVERIAKRSPLRRIGEPDDVGKAVRFLVSEDAAWITGETLVIDGGALVQWGQIPGATRQAVVQP